MTETPNLGLSQWELTDLIKMEDFNSDNLKIDNAVGEINTALAGKISMELLWENASPTSEFVAQTIALDLSEYDAVYVMFHVSPDWGGTDNFGAEVLIPVGKKHYCGFAFYNSIATRATEISTTGVKFSQSSWWQYGLNNNNVQDNANTANIPAKIYGIKGVNTNV